MAIKEIVIKGHPALNAKSTKVENIDNEILNLVQDLKDTLYSTDNGVGLAAPQIGVNKRVVFIDTRDENGPIILINPRIVKKKGKKDSEEGCLSLPGYYGFVERPSKVMVRAFNEKGEKVEYIGVAFFAAHSVMKLITLMELCTVILPLRCIEKRKKRKKSRKCKRLVLQAFYFFNCLYINT
jgi:peptide deformylase